MAKAEWHEIENAYGGILTLDANDSRALNVLGLHMPPVVHRTQQAPTQHGATWVGTVLDPRDIVLSFHSKNCTRLALFELRQKVSRVINPHLGPFTWRTYKADGGVLWELRDVVYDVGLGDTFGTVHQERDLARAVIRLVAMDPVWWGQERLNTEAPGATTATAFVFPLNTGAASETEFDGVNGIAFGGGGGTVELNFNKTYLGTWPAYPIIQILGPADNVVLTNVTTGEVLDFDQLDYDIAAAEVVTIDTRPGQKTVVSDVNGNIIGYLSPDSDLATFHLEIDPVSANGVNAFTFTADNTTGATRLTIRWTDRFLAY